MTTGDILCILAFIVAGLLLFFLDWFMRRIARDDYNPRF